MRSEIYVEAVFRNGQTQIKDQYFTPPYKIMSPFYNGTQSDVMIMAATAGLLGGDVIECEFIARENTNLKIISQSYEKIMNTKEDVAKKTTRIYIEKNGKFTYLPHPVIPFANSNYVSNTEIHLSTASTLIYTDIFSCGRVGSNDERFLMNTYENKVKCFIDGKLGFADNTYINPKLFNYQTLGMWGQYTHNGVLYAYFPTERETDEFILNVREKGKLFHNIEVGVSKSIQGVCVRVLAFAGDTIYSFFHNL